MTEQITSADLRVRQGTAPAPLIIDVRSAAEYAAGHLPGAMHIPADELPGQLAELPADRPIVTYCSLQHPGAARSERAAALLRGHGRDARVLAGGFPAWRDAGQPVEAGARPGAG
jgi:rhodanese-related sulfurtransferase